ncbi:amino-acid N-acetyltransferase [Plasticicumulans acidivorans]|uniref:Amino-acid acetyltransferase n=1 Tax=Plasticicumulans acidivorans TaxID=886464 RepID=A0A317MQ86_9GAMM|nr:amino-acid N-acetyltransferase [Plasticicumulans acidivorans]PWV58463.1 N-acetylglutamate synthase [Plasticicumulans acidivorans]
MNDDKILVHGLRQAVPYINALEHKTLVLLFGGETIADAERFASLIHDIALLDSLGLKLVLVHGARPQVEAELIEIGAEIRYVNGLRVTDGVALDAVKEAVGATRILIEAMLSMGLANSPMHGARLRVASGNAVVARPLGVREGVDYQFTGEVRRIDVELIRAWHAADTIVLLSPLGYSPTGEVFNVSAREVAVAAARALNAEKLVMLTEDGGVPDRDGQLISDLAVDQVETLLHGDTAHLPDDTVEALGNAVTACRGGVKRVHLVPRRVDGSLLLELFTRDGVGTMINADRYEGARRATIDDVGGLLSLIRPLEEDGTLVRRSRELLEHEIGHFTLLERDGTIIGCAALYPFPEEGIAELACVAIHPAYRRGGRADALLTAIEARARAQGISRLFVLTTRTAHFFQERGFAPATIAELPVEKQQMYNFQRRSKVFIKRLS